MAKEASLQSILQGVARLQNVELADHQEKELRRIDFALWDLIQEVEEG